MQEQNNFTNQIAQTTKQVRAAHLFLWNSLKNFGLEQDFEHDIFHSGFIGVENSIITTRSGNLRAKQYSTKPEWTKIFINWFYEAGLKSGDNIFISSSSSFPAMLCSCLIAAENFGLQIKLCVSLGSSSWGANRPELLSADILKILHDNGFIKTLPEFYTLGGINENGGGFSREAIKILSRVENIFINHDLEEAVKIKLPFINNSRLVISIGGNASSMGRDLNALNIPPGLNFSSDNAGNGIAGIALRNNIPVIHVSKIIELAKKFDLD